MNEQRIEWGVVWWAYDDNGEWRSHSQWFKTRNARHQRAQAMRKAGVEVYLTDRKVKAE